MPTMNPIAVLPFLVMVLLFLLFNSAGKKKYAAFIAALDKKEYTLKDIMGIGFYIMELLRYNYGRSLDRKARRSLQELYLAEHVEFYLRVHWASAATYVFISLFLAALFYAVLGDAAVAGVFLLIAIFAAYSVFAGLEKKIQQRHFMVALELPDITNQLLILSGAGLTLRAAFVKIGREMRNDTPMYQAIAQAADKMENGASNEAALDILTTRCDMPEVRRFVSVLLQNMQRGGGDVFIALNEIGREMWDNRKSAARRTAEETSTKMLFPMMLMLISVILLVAAPAVMSMNIM